jgi:ribosomal protein S18 acetylase RimI-like enzyme
MEIKRALAFDSGIRETISEIFVDAYGKDLRFFAKDPARLQRALAHMFALEYFYVAVIDHEIAGMAVCVDTGHFCIRGDRKTLARHLGIVKGLCANALFKYYFNKTPKYPVAVDAKTASVEFVATRAAYRKKGVASAIMNHLFTLPEYDRYILEVADTNTSALALYEKLGYREVYRKKQPFGKYIGLNYLVYMIYSKNRT